MKRININITKKESEIYKEFIYSLYNSSNDISRKIIYASIDMNDDNTIIILDISDIKKEYKNKNKLGNYIYSFFDLNASNQIRILNLLENILLISFDF